MNAFTKKFEGANTFEACRAAEDWCKKQGLSIGSMERGSPRGLMYGDYIIAKWRNLSWEERRALDGAMVGDMRNGPVCVELKQGVAA